MLLTLKNLTFAYYYFSINKKKNYEKSIIRYGNIYGCSCCKRATGYL